MDNRTKFQHPILASAKEALASLEEVMSPTPLQQNVFLCECFSAKIFLKREDLAPVRSNKIRGAFNFFP